MTSPSGTAARLDRDSLVLLLKVMLSPALRFCIRHSIGVYELLELVKTRLVELAEEELEGNDERVSVSRISVATGIHRPDVTRILKERAPYTPSLSLVTRVIGKWEQDPEYCTSGSNPKLLTFSGENSDFWQLVESITKSVSPATVLAELERRGLVLRDRNRLRLVQEIHFRTKQSKEAYEIISKNIDSLIRSAEQNVYQTAETKNLYLRTEYDNILKREVPKIRRWLFEQGVEFHKRARDYISRFDQDIHPSPTEEGGARVVLGAFSLTEKE